MADTRLRAIIESIYQSQGTDAAKAGMQGVKTATTEMGLAQAAAQAQVDMLTKKMRELSAEVANGNKTIDQATKEFNDYKNTLKPIPGAIQETATATENAGSAFGGLSGVLGKLAAAGFLAKIGQEALEFGKASVQAAGDAAEMQSKFDVVFGESAPQAQTALQALGEQVNRSAVELQGMAASIQDTFVPLGFARDEAASLSVQLTQLAVDVGSFNNVADADVMRDFQSALVGNTETVRKYGIVITEANTKQKAYEMGITETGAALTEQEKVQARLQLILEGTTDAQGDAIRTADSYANTQKGLQAATLDLQVALGGLATEGLAGVNQEAATLITNLTNLIGWVGQVDDAFQAHEKEVVKTTTSYEDYVAEMQRSAQVTGKQIVFTNELTDAELETIDAIRGLTEEEYNAVSAAMRLNDEGGKLADGFEVVAEKADEATTALEGQAMANTALTLSIQGLVETMNFGKDATALLNEGLRTGIDTTSELNARKIELLFITGQITEAEKAEYLAQNEQIENMQQLNKLLEAGYVSWEQYLAIVADGTVTMDEMSGAVSETASALLDANIASDTQMWEDMADTMGDLYNHANDVQEVFAPIYQEMLETGKGLEMLTTNAGPLQTALAGVVVTGSEASIMVGNLASEAAALQGTYNVHFNITQSGSIPSFSSSADVTQKSGETAIANAGGGDVYAGQRTWVGEQGTEMFIPDVPGTIVPNNQIGGMTGNVNVAPPIVYVFLDTAQVAAKVEVRQGQTYRQRTGGGYRP